MSVKSFWSEPIDIYLDEIVLTLKFISIDDNIEEVEKEMKKNNIQPSLNKQASLHDVGSSSRIMTKI